MVLPLDKFDGMILEPLGHFTCWITPLAQWNRYVYSQASRSNNRGHLHVLKYLLFIIIILDLSCSSFYFWFHILIFCLFCVMD